MIVNLQGLRTYAVGVLMMIVGALPEVLAGTDWEAFVVDPKTGLGLIIGAVAMIVMRKVTQQTTVKTALRTPPPEE